MDKTARERIKAEAEKIKAQKAAQPAKAAKLVPKSPDAAGAILASANGTLTYQCGHEAQAKNLGLCKGCKAKFRQEQAAKKREKRFAAESGRLPHGSSFTAIYDAKAVLWRGILTVSEGTTVQAESSGILALFPKLDALYRAWLKEQP